MTVILKMWKSVGLKKFFWSTRCSWGVESLCCSKQTEVREGDKGQRLNGWVQTKLKETQVKVRRGVAGEKLV